mmetsp:Transcript_658/g.2714  ORF Transcript_658/g.2714 Transcript_658/m.2714 type:complete len:278 (-) Transcript_658:127-960(-)
MHQRMTHEHSSRFTQLHESILHVAQRRRRREDVLRLQPSNLRSHVDDVPRRLHERLQQNISLLIHHGHPDERSRVVIRLTHLTIHPQQPRLHLFLHAPTHGSILCPSPRRFVRRQPIIRLREPLMLSRSSHQRPRSITLRIDDLVVAPLVPLRAFLPPLIVFRQRRHARRPERRPERLHKLSQRLRRVPARIASLVLRSLHVRLEPRLEVAPRVFARRGGESTLRILDHAHKRGEFLGARRHRLAKCGARGGGRADAPTRPTRSLPQPSIIIQRIER